MCLAVRRRFFLLAFREISLRRLDDFRPGALPEVEFRRLDRQLGLRRDAARLHHDMETAIEVPDELDAHAREPARLVDDVSAENFERHFDFLEIIFPELQARLAEKQLLQGLPFLVQTFRLEQVLYLATHIDSPMGQGPFQARCDIDADLTKPCDSHFFHCDQPPPVIRRTARDEQNLN